MAAFFEFLNYPKIVSGQCALENIPAELAGYDAQKPLVIAGTQMVQRGLIKKFLKAFSDSTVVIGAVYDKISNYAGITQVQEAADLYNNRGCDAIIALGNGSVVDVAKAVNVLVSEKTHTLKAYHDGGDFRNILKPLVVVPSCCFNGWEATRTMIVDNRQITSERLFPQTVIIDARMLKQCHPTCILESGVITFLHAYTALISDDFNPMNTAVAHTAMRLLCDNWVQAVRGGADGEALQALANAAIIAQAAFSNVGPGLVHLLAEVLSKVSGISIGKLVLALLPSALDPVESKATSIKEALYLAMVGMEQYAAKSSQGRPDKAVAAIRQLIDEVVEGGGASLKDLKVQEHLLDKTAQEVSAISNGLFDETQCLAILTKSWSGDGRQ